MPIARFLGFIDWAVKEIITPAGAIPIKPKSKEDTTAIGVYNKINNAITDIVKQIISTVWGFLVRSVI